MKDASPDCPPPEPLHCELCGRPAGPLTRHHLIPRTRHRNRRARRTFDRRDMQNRLLWVCLACHNHIHDLLTEKELERHYNTRERLLAHPDMARFVEWIAGKPPGFKPRGRAKRSR